MTIGSRMASLDCSSVGSRTSTRRTDVLVKGLHWTQTTTNRSNWKSMGETYDNSGGPMMMIL